MQEAEPIDQKPTEVNRDNLDEVISQLKTTVNLSLEDQPPLTIEFKGIGDFDPDRICERVEQFQDAPAIPDEGEKSDPSVDELFAQWEAKPFPEHRETAADVTPRRAALMRAILHHPAFQALEAAWRGVDLLLRRLEDDPLLKLYILDLSKEEAARDVTATGGLQSSQLYRALVEETVAKPGANLWAIVIGNYGFDQGAGDAELLDRLALLARFATAPFLAQAEPPSSAPSDTWIALRNSTNAKYIGLALPRMLLRRPYGRDTVSIQSFEFEELPGEPSPADYLWGNPAFLCALLLALSFSKYGWRFRPGIIHQVGGLPLHTYEVEGEARSQPCAAALLTDEEIESLLDQGFIPVTSMPNGDAARVVRFQSIAEPLAVLSGRWS